jgi:hypothetical protein
VKLTVYRLIPLVLVLDLGALFLSGVPRYKRAHGTLDTVLSYSFWFGFLLGAVALVVLVAVALRRARRRSAVRAPA